jgi:hypothetical protein
MLILWIVAGLIAVMLSSQSPQIGEDRSQVVTASLALAFGTWAFWHQGGPQITASGLYCLSVAIFVGYAGLWWAWQPGAVSHSVTVATLTGYWTTLAMYTAWWSKQAQCSRLQASSPAATHWGVWMGLVAAAVGTGLAQVGYGSIVQFSIGAFALLAVAIMLHRSQGQQVLGRLILGAVVVAVFWQTSFSGYGRLNIVALGLVVLVLASSRTDTHKVKGLVLIGAPLALWAFVRIREQLGVEVTGNAYDGLGSVVNPLFTFGRLVENHQEGLYSLGGGSTFAATATFWVPSAWWPEKPPGFGAELVRLLYPDLQFTNHSIAAHSYGEWYFNFGWFGVAAMVVMLGGAIRWLDRLLARSTALPIDSARRLVLHTAVLIAVAGVPTMMWVGSFTYASRVGQQMLILAAVVAPFAWRRRSERSRHSDPTRRRT